jgi:hypothetical protein
VNDAEYFSPAMQQKYMSVSQFKAFRKCEAAALSAVYGQYTQEQSTALLVGSYVDAHFDGTLDAFKASHPEILKRDGTLKADYAQADQIIERVERDTMFAKYMSGDKQVVMFGEIAGVPYKIKMDSYHAGKAIVDLKIVRDFQKLWDGHARVPFIEYWGYDVQGAVYQEIVRQNTGETLPFFIAAATKESTPDIAVLSIGQDRLDYCLEEVKRWSPRYNGLKTGEIETPERCGHCSHCKETKIIEKIVDYRDLEEM